MPRERPAKGKRPTPEDAFGQVLRRLRLAAGLSQDELAHRSGYARNFIGLLERGQNSPSLRTVFNLADVFDHRPSKLVADIEKLLNSSE